MYNFTSCHIFNLKVQKELDNFYKIYETKIETDDLESLRSYLFQLLSLPSISDILGFYEATKQDNFTLISFENEIDRFDDIEMFKVKMIACFTNLVTLR